jgi:hypothetical protein
VKVNRSAGTVNVHQFVNGNSYNSIVIESKHLDKLIDALQKSRAFLTDEQWLSIDIR